ncbi:MAG: GTP-binding protein [Eubacterium sp.]
MNLPKLILLSGFLGTGKTTLLNETIRFLNKKNMKTAIIINEAGETGVDNRYLKKKGYENIKELFGGCICCTMAENLREMVEDLVKTEKVEVILMEPSGTADPAAIYKPLERAGYTPETIHHVALLDPLRAEAFLGVLEPLFESALPLSECIILSKTDLATPEMMSFSENLIHRYNTSAPILKMNLREGLNKNYCDYLNTFLDPSVVEVV